MKNRLNSLDLGRFRSPVTLGVIGGIIILLLVWWFALMVPASNKLDSVNAQQAQLQSQVSTLNAKITQLQQESAQVKKELPYLARFQAAVPAEPNQGDIVVQINGLANKTGVNMSTISDNLVVGSTPPGGLSTIPVNLAVTGTHQQVFNFLSGFYKLPRLMTISSIVLSPGTTGGGTANINKVNDGASYGLTMTATAYTSALPAAPAA